MLRVLGRKDDQEKPRWELLPVRPLLEVVKVLTVGAKKYGDYNWRHVEPFYERYYGALLRHISAWRMGETHDQETGLHHLAHAICCLIFLLEGPKNDGK